MRLDTFLAILDKLSEWTETLVYVPIIDLISAEGTEPWKILVGTMLSARTRDETTSRILQKLFKMFPDLKSLAGAELEEIEEAVYPVGFYRVKARNLRSLARTLVEKYDGEVPDTVEELVKLPGVGVKTASLVVIRAFGKDDICVDTHVHRLVNMWKVVNTKTPKETRERLKKILPRSYWKELNRLLVTLGQKVCTPTSHKCEICPVNRLCPERRCEK